MKTTITLLFILFLTVPIFAAGEVDPTFNASAYRQSISVPFTPVREASVVTSALQSDGKLLIGGVFGVISGVGRNSIARLNADGTIDTSFNPPDLYDLNNNLNPGNVFALAFQSNGKILVGGSFGVNGSTARSLIRLNGDGSLDTTFSDLSAQFETTELIYEINVRPDDSIYIAGYIELANSSGFLTSGIARLNGNGALETAFQLARVNQFGINVVKAIAVTTDNTVYAAPGTQTSTSAAFRRYNSNGTVDSSFPSIQLSSNSEVYKIVLQPDGKILLGGSFTTLNSFTQKGISRVTPEGIIDTNFNPGDGLAGTGAVYDFDFTADGKIIVTGAFAGYRNVTQVAIFKLNLDGTRDTTFNSPFPTINTAQTATIQNDGKIIIFSFRGRLQRLNPNGSVDNSYPQVLFGFAGTVNDLVQQPDGKIIAGGDFNGTGNLTRFNLVRFNADGSLDVPFNSNIAAPVGTVHKVVLLADGKILISSASGVLRLNTDGTRDTTFTALAVGSKQDLEILADGKILVGGRTRLNANGSVDNTYSSPNLAGGSILTTAIQPDGKILIGGDFSQVNAVGRRWIARLNADGTLDTTFIPPNFAASGGFTNIESLPGGKIIATGSQGGGSSFRSFILRLNSDGSSDPSFNTTNNNEILALKIQPDGKILIGGTFTLVNGVARNCYARLNADGTLGVPSGANNTVNVITLQTDGKILLGGDFSRVNNVPAVGIARLLNVSAPTRTQYDFDGDRRADIAVFRPSNGFWYVLPSQTSAFYGFPFGQAGDQIAPADYDGDGRTDIAVFRDTVPGAGNFAYFYITNSADNSFRAVQFGAIGDVPVPGDWDGDGKADLAVYRAASAAGGQSNFYYRPSSQPTVDFVTLSLGTMGDKPVPADYDGDGRLDPAVFRPSNATWYVLRSSVNQIQQTAFGLGTDIPVPADLDGDGLANIAMFRPSNGTWYTSTNAANNFGAIQFGANGDLPIPADYDGDGRADVAVFRPSNGAWYLNRTTSGFTGVQFGASGDKPAPNAYTR